ncbi:hypothetical protein FDP41_013024 [Naegleria fowleri]|uniref:F-box domain-containing protein n=1 Tax=Naegleria fowleri TaxID=5763 RepID=A0A6A5C0M9_NAEFO|nr:uncharacterized protein FDP41_013024 [Naegleria fowleri]KAF0981236.1 hypothetical protein FDP41_013024 [Naegleria fowleri]CAG4716144.1 unnamed protein product [Naegleria fowleri]
MFDSDCLLSIFKFLDFSHVPKISLVCTHWNEIARSNALWEWYFHLLSNNKKGKTSIETTVLEKDDLFWRNMIRDHFSKYRLRTTHKINSLGFFDFSNQMHFMKQSMVHPFLNQFAKFLFGRIRVENIYCTDNNGTLQTYSKDNDIIHLEDRIFDILQVKIKMKISGLDECIIARTKYPYDAGFGLFGHPYTPGAFIYISTETHDFMNEKLQKPPSENIRHIPLSDLNVLQNCFLYVFHGRNVSPTLIGEQYLEDTVLSKCVPTLTQFNLCPRSVIPLFCYIVSCVCGIIDGCSCYQKKEFTHGYPCISNNIFMHYERYARYSERVRSRIPIMRNYILSNPRHIDVNVCNTINQMIAGKRRIVTSKLNRKERLEYWKCLQGKALTSKQKQIYFQNLFEHDHDTTSTVDDVSGEVIEKEILSFQKALELLNNQQYIIDCCLRYKSSKFKSVEGE